jgi:hypothetical protein
VPQLPSGTYYEFYTFGTGTLNILLEMQWQERMSGKAIGLM